MYWYDYVPKVQLTKDGMVLDAIFIIVEVMQLILATWAIHKYAKKSKKLSFAYGLVLIFIIFTIRETLWTFLVDWVMFNFSTMTSGHVFLAYIRVFIGLAVLSYPFYRMYKAGDVAFGKVTRFTAIIVLFFQVTSIWLGFPDFRQPSTCKTITPNEALIYHIISMCIWIPFAVSLFYDAKHKKVKKVEQTTTIVRHAKVKNE